MKSQHPTLLSTLQQILISENIYSICEHSGRMKFIPLQHKGLWILVDLRTSSLNKHLLPTVIIIHLLWFFISYIMCFVSKFTFHFPSFDEQKRIEHCKRIWEPWTMPNLQSQPIYAWLKGPHRTFSPISTPPHKLISRSLWRI